MARRRGGGTDAFTQLVAPAALTIAGAGFGRVTGVRLGDTEPSWFHVDSTTRLRAVVPPHAAGPVHVTIVSAHGVSGPTAGSIATYAAPPRAVTTPAPPVAQPGCVVPDLSGHRLPGARRLLLAAGCRLGHVYGARHHRHRARVVRQGPSAGAQRPADTRVAVRVHRRHRR